MISKKQFIIKHSLLNSNESMRNIDMDEHKRIDKIRNR